MLDLSLLSLVVAVLIAGIVALLEVVKEKKRRPAVQLIPVRNLRHMRRHSSEPGTGR